MMKADALIAKAARSKIFLDKIQINAYSNIEKTMKEKSSIFRYIRENMPPAESMFYGRKYEVHSGV